jgi:hypothetical protein
MTESFIRPFLCWPTKQCEITMPGTPVLIHSWYNIGECIHCGHSLNTTRLSSCSLHGQPTSENCQYVRWAIDNIISLIHSMAPEASLTGSQYGTYLATPPGTLHTSLVTKKLHRPTCLQCSASFSKSKSSPIGQPQPARSTS